MAPETAPRWPWEALGRCKFVHPHSVCHANVHPCWSRSRERPTPSRRSWEHPPPGVGHANVDAQRDGHANVLTRGSRSRERPPHIVRHADFQARTSRVGHANVHPLGVGHANISVRGSRSREQPSHWSRSRERPHRRSLSWSRERAPLRSRLRECQNPQESVTRTSNPIGVGHANVHPHPTPQ